VLGWIGLVPWLAVLDRTRSWRGALAAGVVMAAAFELAVFGWFARAIQTYTGASWLIAILLLLAASPLLQPQLVTHAVARRLARARDGDPARFWTPALVAAAVYVGTEALVPKLFADTLGHGLYPSLWLRQGADVAGAHGLTFAVIVANECLLAIVHALRADPSGRRRVGATAPLGCLVAIVAVLSLYGGWRCQRLAVGDAADVTNADGSRAHVGAAMRSRAGRPLTAALVQANISHYDALRAEIGSYEAVRRILDTYVALSTEALAGASVDLLMWPETVYPTTFGSPKSEDGAAFDREIVSFVDETGIPLIFGSYDADGADEFNAAVFLEPRVATDGAPTARTFQSYRKAALFPLTERVPWLLDSDMVRRWLPWLGTWKSGAGTDVVTIVLRDGTPVRIAPLICYDVLDPRLALSAVRRGAELIVTLSNDSWFSAGPGPRMHLIGAAFLSIETRRPQLRATNTGISAVIDAAGTLLTTAAVDQRATLLATVTPSRGDPTVMVRWGDWFGPTALVAALVFFALDWTLRRGRM